MNQVGNEERRVKDIGLVLEAAERLDRSFGEQIRKDPLLSVLVEGYRAAIDASHAVMEQSVMVSLCTACARQEPGGCCFRQVEEGYDPVLLLINRLLGVALPDRREVPDNCFFLGEKGCKIPARYYFCVNFLCERLKSGINEDMMREVLACSGRELQQGAELEYALRRWLATRGVDPDSAMPSNAPSS